MGTGFWVLFLFLAYRFRALLKIPRHDGKDEWGDWRILMRAWGTLTTESKLYCLKDNLRCRYNITGSVIGYLLAHCASVLCSSLEGAGQMTRIIGTSHDHLARA